MSKYVCHGCILIGVFVETPIFWCFSCKYPCAIEKKKKTKKNEKLPNKNKNTKDYRFWNVQIIIKN